MDIPIWLVIALTVVVMGIVLLLGVVLDVLIGKPNFLVPAITVIIAVLFSGGLFWQASRDRLVRRRRLAQVSETYQLWALKPHEMEGVASELFRLQGYVVTENKRPDLADGGVDFEIFKDSKTWLVQVKHWRLDVDVKEVRELWGLVASEGAEGGVLIGTSGFSRAAHEFAEGKDLRLMDGSEFLTIRSQLSEFQPAQPNHRDPMITDGFATYLATQHHPACRTCGKPMVLVTLLHETAIAKQFWGCKNYPDCKSGRTFAFPYLPVNDAESKLS